MGTGADPWKHMPALSMQSKHTSKSCSSNLWGIARFVIARMACGLANITYGDAASEDAEDKCISWRVGYFADWDL